MGVLFNRFIATEESTDWWASRASFVRLAAEEGGRTVVIVIVVVEKKNDDA